MGYSKATGKAKHPHDSKRPEPAAVRRALEKNDREALKIALTPRQRRFCEEYILDFNGSAAAVRAGYSVNSVDKQAYTLLHHKGVSAYIDHLTRSKEAKVMSVNPDYLLQRLSDIMNKDEARDGDKLRAIEMYMKHLGMFVDRQEITGKDGGAIEVQEQRIQQDVDSLVSTIKRMGQKDATTH
jgi:phage terminase small subunit